MLNPLFRAKLTNTVNGLGIPVVTIDTNPLPEGTSYQVDHYTQYAGYTLVSWSIRVQGNPNYATGEALWHNNIPVAVSGGTVSLYSIPDIPTTGRAAAFITDRDVWDRVHPRVGAYGVPAHIALMLQDANNKRYV